LPSVPASTSAARPILQRTNESLRYAVAATALQKRPSWPDVAKVRLNGCGQCGQTCQL